MSSVSKCSSVMKLAGSGHLLSHVFGMWHPLSWTSEMRCIFCWASTPKAKYWLGLQKITQRIQVCYGQSLASFPSWWFSSSLSPEETTWLSLTHFSQGGHIRKWSSPKWLIPPARQYPQDRLVLKGALSFSAKQNLVLWNKKRKGLLLFIFFSQINHKFKHFKKISRCRYLFPFL